MPWWQFSIFSHNSFCNSIWQGLFHWPPSGITIWAIADHRYWGAFGFWRRWTTLEVKNRHKKKSITCACLWVCLGGRQVAFFFVSLPIFAGTKICCCHLVIHPDCVHSVIFCFSSRKNLCSPLKKIVVLFIFIMVKLFHYFVSRLCWSRVRLYWPAFPSFQVQVFAVFGRCCTVTMDRRYAGASKTVKMVQGQKIMCVEPHPPPSHPDPPDPIRSDFRLSLLLVFMLRCADMEVRAFWPMNPPPFMLWGKNQLHLVSFIALQKSDCFCLISLQWQ